MSKIRFDDANFLRSLAATLASAGKEVASDHLLRIAEGVEVNRNPVKYIHCNESEDIENRTMRCQVEGAIPLAMHDPSDRRGLWARVVVNNDAGMTVPLCPTEIELFAGREGDDAYVKLSVGDVLTPETMEKLGSVINYAEDAYWMGREDEEIDPE